MGWAGFATRFSDRIQSGRCSPAPHRQPVANNDCNISVTPSYFATRFRNSSVENATPRGKLACEHRAYTFSVSCITKSSSRIASWGLGRYFLIVCTASLLDKGCSPDNSRRENIFSFTLSKKESASAILIGTARRKPIRDAAASFAGPRRHQNVVNRRFGALSIAARRATSQSADHPQTRRPNSSSTWSIRAAIRGSYSESSSSVFRMRVSGSHHLP